MRRCKLVLSPFHCTAGRWNPAVLYQTLKKASQSDINHNRVNMAKPIIDLNLGTSEFSNVEIPKRDPLASLFEKDCKSFKFPGTKNVIRVPNVASVSSLTQIDTSANGYFIRLSSPSKFSKVFKSCQKLSKVVISCHMLS